MQAKFIWVQAVNYKNDPPNIFSKNKKNFPKQFPKKTFLFENFFSPS